MDVSETRSARVQTILSNEGESLNVELNSLDSAPDAEWQFHMAGRIEASNLENIEALEQPAAMSERLARMRAVAPERYYAAILGLGFGYGPGFRGIVELW